MITFKISGAKHQIPTAWGDVTFDQCVKLLKTPNNRIDQIALFTQIPRDTLATAELKGVEKIAIALSFLDTNMKFEPGPTRMVGPYVLPRDVTLESLGQFEDLRELMRKLPQKNPDDYTADDHAEVYELYLSACAIYLQKILNGEYDPQQVENVKIRLRIFSCIEVIQTGAFFFYKPLNISQGTTSRSQRIIQRLKRLLQDFPGYRKSLDSLLPSSKPQSK